MTGERLNDGQREQLAADVDALAWTWARRALDPDAPPAAGPPDLAPARTRQVQLALLAVLEDLRTAVDDRARQAARTAAAAGADYADLGAAAAITRQGARKRWPGLAELTRAGRARGRETAATDTSGPPPFEAEIYVPDAAFGAIVGHLIDAGYTGREAVRGAAGVHIGLPDRTAAEALRKRLAEAGYRPGDVTEP